MQTRKDILKLKENLELHSLEWIRNIYIKYKGGVRAEVKQNYRGRLTLRIEIKAQFYLNNGYCNDLYAFQVTRLNSKLPQVTSGRT